MIDSPRARNLLLLCYAALLFSILGLTPLWLDEILQLGAARGGTWHQLIQWVSVNAGASPLPYLFQKAFVTAFGYSAYAVRFPAALCSVLAGAVFAALTRRFTAAGFIALGMFLLLPLQFRYGLEARVYSQGLLCSLLSLWLFLRLAEKPSTTAAVLYGLSVAAGLYSQPLTVFPVIAQMIYLPRVALPAGGLAILSFLPWYWWQHAQQALLVTPPAAFFSIRQIMPFTLLHDLTGGGAVCTVALLVLVGRGVFSRDLDPAKKKLLVITAAVALAGPIAMDAWFNYFFAARQLLFAMPALVLLGAYGINRRTWAILAAFVLTAAVKDVQDAVTPKDDLASTAEAIALQLPRGACFETAPAEHANYYLFFRPDLRDRVCVAEFHSPVVLAVVNEYTTMAERKAMLDALSREYRSKRTFRTPNSELHVFGKQ